MKTPVPGATRWSRSVYAILLIAPLALFAPLWAAGKALFWGTPALQFVPWWNFAVESLQAGELPLWNPWVGLGAPLLANYQSALVYPPIWLYLIAGWLGGTAWLAWAQALLVALHLGLAAVGMARLARSLGLSRFSQLISALAFGLSAYLVARAGFLSINAAAAWLPWVVYYAGPAPDGAARRWLRLVLSLALLLLAGHAQTAWYTLLLAGFWAIYCGLSAQPAAAWRDRTWQAARLVARLLLAGVVAAALAALQLLPTAEYLLQSQRSSAVNFELAMTYSFWPWRLLTFVAPNLFGSPAEGNYWGYGNFWEDAGYIGLLPLLLALAVLAGFAWRLLQQLPLIQRLSASVARFQQAVRTWSERTLKLKLGETGEKPVDEEFSAEAVPPVQQNAWQRPSLILFLAGLAGAALLLAMGKNTPLFPWLYRNVPSFSMFQAPARYLIWAEFALALLAGIGAQTWRRPVKAGLYWTRLGTMGAFAIMVGAGLALLTMGEISPTFIRATAIAGFWGVGAGVLSLLAPVAPRAGKVETRTRRTVIWQSFVIGFVTLDLMFAGWSLNPGVDLSFYQQPAALAAEIKDLAQDGRVFLTAASEQQLKFKRFLRFSSFDPREDWGNLRQVMLPNLNMLEHIASANNFDPLVPGRYARWMAEIEALPQAAREEWLRRMGVTLVQQTSRSQPFGVRFRRVANSQLARWVPCAQQVADGEQALDHLRSTRLDMQSWVILEAGGGSFAEEVCAPGALQDRPASNLTILNSRSNGQVLQVQAPVSGWLVLSQTWYPGWQAQVNGQPAEVLRADYLFQAVRVPAGESTVVVSYRPFSFLLGAVLSGLTLAGLVVAWVLGRRQGWVS